MVTRLDNGETDSWWSGKSFYYNLRKQIIFTKLKLRKRQADSGFRKPEEERERERAVTSPGRQAELSYMERYEC